MKKFIAFTSALALICTMTACSGDSEVTEAPAAETVTVSQTMYKEDRAEFPYGFGFMGDIAYVEGRGTRIAYSSGDSFSFADYDENMQPSDPVELFSAEHIFNSRTCIEPDGTISVFLIYAVSDRDKSDPEYYKKAEFSFELRTFDPDGGEKSVISLDDLKNYFQPLENIVTFFYPYGDKWIVGFDDGTLLIDENGEVAENSDKDISTECYGIDSEGNYIFADDTEFGYVDGTTLKEPQTMSQYGKYLRLGRGMFAGQGDFKAFFVLTDGIFGLTKSGEVVEVLDFIDSRITLNEVYAAAYVAEGKFAIYGANDAGRYLSLLTVRPDDYVENRQKVVVGVATNEYGWTMDQAEMISKYNKKSENYDAELRTYSLDIDDVRNDILAGDAPDVYCYTGKSNMIKLVNLGAAEDMNELSGKYGGFSQDDILDNVVEALGYKGGLYAISQKFSLPVAIGRSEYFPSGTMSYDEFFDIVDNMPDGMYFGNNDFTSPEQVFAFLCTANLSSWVDYEKGECWFDSPEFIRVLEFTKSVPLQPKRDWEEFYATATEEEAQIVNEEEMRKVHDGKALLMTQYLFGLSSISDLRTAYGFEEGGVAYVTPPSFEPKGRIGIYDEMSIIKNGSCVEGGWDYVNFVMSDDFLRSYLQTEHEFVTRRESFDKMIEEGQKISHNPVYTDEAGITHNNYAFGVAITDEEIADLREYISTCTVLQDSDAAIEEIVNEEYGAYAAGDVSAERCAELIQNRVSIYLSENS